MSMFLDMLNHINTLMNELQKTIKDNAFLKQEIETLKKSKKKED